MIISNETKKQLLLEARNHLEHKLKGSGKGSLPEKDLFLTKPGIFVTLQKNKELRGCIGHIIGYEPLFESLYTLAEASAFEDPRFNSLEAHELKDITIEISLLSEPESIEHWQDIEIGLHGIIIKKDIPKLYFFPKLLRNRVGI